MVNPTIYHLIWSWIKNRFYNCIFEFHIHREDWIMLFRLGKGFYIHVSLLKHFAKQFFVSFLRNFVQTVFSTVKDIVQISSHQTKTRKRKQTATPQKGGKRNLLLTSTPRKEIGDQFRWPNHIDIKLNNIIDWLIKCCLRSVANISCIFRTRVYWWMMMMIPALYKHAEPDF